MLENTPESDLSLNMNMDTEQHGSYSMEQQDEYTITELEENHFATEAAKNALLGRIYTEKSLSKKVVKGMIRRGWGILKVYI